VDFAFNWLLQFAREPNHPVGVILLALAAGFEYLFPPFPGDTITLFGSSFLVTQHHWNAIVVFVALLCGSQLGAMAAFWVGRRVKARRVLDDPESKQRLDRLVRGFARHGACYLIINRFVPVFRPLFFIAAGLAHMKTGPVLFYSTISAVLWNGLLMTLGILLGVHFDTLMAWLSTYTTVALCVLGAVIICALTLRFRRR
jgi:membrane protein DedA with SNARE-associated domain